MIGSKRLCTSFLNVLPLPVGRMFDSEGRRASGLGRGFELDRDSAGIRSGISGMSSKFDRALGNVGVISL